MKLLIGIAIALSAWTTLLASEPSAQYQVVFEADWSSQTHPAGFPGGAHFSPLIGALHNDQVQFWGEGLLSSSGMESMAETGATGALSAEINSSISANTSSTLLIGPAAGSPDSVSINISVNEDYPLLTLVTMIAPSPDWFLGIAGVSLRQNGGWVNELSIELYAYDAGTDSGLNYTSSNQNTNPAEPIFMINTSPFQTGSPSLGRFIISRTDSPNAFIRGDINDDAMINIADVIAGLDALFNGGLLNCAPAADANDDGMIDISDAVTILSHLFAGAGPLAPPTTCGLDPTPDSLCCDQSSCP